MLLKWLRRVWACKGLHGLYDRWLLPRVLRVGANFPDGRPKEHFERLKIKGSLEGQETIRIKLSGDGTNRIGKRLKVNFIHTILTEKKKDMSEKGKLLWCDWGYQINRDFTYDNLKENLVDIRTEMAHLKEIKVDNVKYTIEYYDVTKIKPGFSLISILGRQVHARKLLTLYSRSKQYSYKSSPLFDFIAIDH